MSETTKTSVSARPGTAPGRPARATIPRRRASDLSSYDCSDIGDRSGLDIVKDCLELMLSLEFFQRYKARSFELLEIGSGSSVLEVGCGTGVDARQLAYMVGEKGSVHAVDKSESMIAEVRRQPGLPKALVPKVADVCRLPFEDGMFHAVRVDRTLQHVKDLETAVREMVRVVASGGRVVACEPDWGTLQIDSEDVKTTRTMARVLCDSIRHGWVGRSIYRHFAAVGLTDIEVYPENLIMTDFNTANEVLHIGRTLRDCVIKGLLDESAARSWFEDLRERDDQGQFFSVLTLYLVRGRKPLNRPQVFERFLQNLTGNSDE
jgi:ubiquinone/menaquinone biosynthesis C-methylase UbiE